MRLFYAFKVFFQILFSGDAAKKVHLALNPPADAPKETTVVEKVVEKIVEKKVVEKPLRSDALTLLAALQREARFVDFLQEDLQPYDDAQVGAIVRDVHRGCAGVVKRMFDVKPLTDAAEGSSLTIDAPVDPLKYQISGSAKDSGSVTGTVVHPGWQATHCDVPVWTGKEDAALVIAPVEIEK